jgi:hypothetical protein
VEGKVAFSTLLLPAVLQFVIVTTLFAAIEVCQQKYHILDRWNPRALPPLRDPLKISRANTLFEMFFTLAFVLCWLRIPGASYAVAYLFLGPVASYFAPANLSPLIYAPAWQIFYLPILLVVLLNLAQHGLNFGFPRWTRNRLIVRVSLSFLGLLLTFFLFRAGDLLLVNPEIADATRYSSFAFVINNITHYSLLAGAAIALWGIFWQIRRILRIPAEPSPSRAASLAC